jgi:heme-degrading monooxygenase HmoA
MFVLNVDLKVRADSTRTLENTFKDSFQPAISSQPGFDHVLLLHSGKNQNEYRLVLAFRDEPSQKRWVATSLHQQVWPKMEANCVSYRVDTFRAI